MRNFVFLFCFLLNTMALCAQVSQHDTLDSNKLLLLAKKYRLGINCDVDVKKAIGLYGRLIEKNNPYAMYELGDMYLTGDGVKCNYKKAYSLFSFAAKHNVGMAFCKMALMHQKGLGRPLNLHNAYLLYSKAAKMSVGQGFYGVGYLLFKGLGVKQNFQKAIDNLVKGSELNHPACSFLLGVYYASATNGKRDQVLATRYFEQALKQGHGWTTDITKFGVLDSLERQATRVSKLLPELKKCQDYIFSMKNNFTGLSNLNQLEGSWNGKCFTLDWNENHVLEVQPVTITFELNENGVSMDWLEADSLVTRFTPQIIDGVWKECKISKDKSDDRFVITSAKYELKGNILLATIRRLNPREREFLKPVIVVLNKKVEVSNYLKNNFDITSARFISDNTLELGVHSRESQSVVINVNTSLGIAVKKNKNISLSKGDNLFLFNLNLAKGFYIVTVNSKTCRKSKVVLNK